MSAKCVICSQVAVGVVKQRIRVNGDASTVDVALCALHIEPFQAGEIREVEVR